MSQLIYVKDYIKLYQGVAENLDMLENESVSLTVTSPPFNIKTGNGVAWKVIEWYDDDMPEDEYQKWQLTVLDEVYRVTKENGSLFYQHKNRMCGGITISPLQWIFKSKWLLHQEIVWSRMSTHNKNTSYFWDSTERIYWLSKNNSPFYNHIYGKASTIWQIQFETNTQHPAPFPVELPIRCIQACSKPGDSVLDCFCGSGTTGVAAKQLGRRFVGVEKNDEPWNFPLAIRRIEAAHNIEAEFATVKLTQESML